MVIICVRAAGYRWLTLMRRERSGRGVIGKKQIEEERG
jgi:hypothetical protein